MSNRLRHLVAAGTSAAAVADAVVAAAAGDTTASPCGRKTATARRLVDLVVARVAGQQLIVPWATIKRVATGHVPVLVRSLVRARRIYLRSRRTKSFRRATFTRVVGRGVPTPPVDGAKTPQQQTGFPYHTRVVAPLLPAVVAAAVVVVHP